MKKNVSSKSLMKAGAITALMSFPAMGFIGCSTPPDTIAITPPSLSTQVVDQLSKPNPEPTPPPAEPVVTPSASPSTASTLAYKNGNYQADGNYISPGGKEVIGLQLTLKDDVVTEARVQSKAENPISQKFQEMFVTNYQEYVIGKNINELNLTKVSGSSLTPKGFNDAIQKIKAEAKS